MTLPPDTRPSADFVAGAVAGFLGVSPDLIMADHRGAPDVARARWMAFAVWRDLRIDGASSRAVCLAAIGRAFGRDRTTVRHGLEQFRELCASDTSYLRAYRTAMELLG